MTNELFEQVYYPRYKAVIRQLARKLARRDEPLFEDLVQTGMIALWKLNPSKATSNEDAFVRQALYNKMVDVLRKERPAIYESLQAHLARGDQLVLNPETNEAMLVEASIRPRRIADESTEFEDES